MNSLIKLLKKKIETYFIKKRCVFMADKNTDINNFLDNPDFNIIKSNKFNKDEVEDYIEIISKYKNKEKVYDRLENPIITLYMAIEKDSLELAGFWWVAGPSEQVIWHDKFCVNPGNLLAVEGYVIPKYRGKGVLPLIIATTINDYIKTGKSHYLFYTVEKSNISSIKANQKVAKIVETNYLIKLFKRNVFSVYIGSKGWRCYYVFRNAKGRGF